MIWGLTQLKQYSRLDEYITRVLNESREEVDFVGERIKDPILAGVILSKLSRARESGVALFIDETSNLPVARDPEIAHGLVTIIGNLLDNAFEAVKDTADRRTDFAIHQSLDSLKLSVADNGPGIPPTMKEQIFEKHFSTKGEGRGYGLFLVARAVEKLGGNIEVISNKERGTVFLVTAPYPAGGDAID